MLVDLLVQLGLASHDRVQALDRGDRHSTDRIDDVRRKTLHVVELGELPSVVRSREALELLQRLPAEVGSVHQEQDSPGSSELHETISRERGEKGLAGTGRHLDQGAGTVLGERMFEVGDRDVLRWPEQPHFQRWHLSKARAERRLLR